MPACTLADSGMSVTGAAAKKRRISGCEKREEENTGSAAAGGCRRKPETQTKKATFGMKPSKARRKPLISKTQAKSDC